VSDSSHSAISEFRTRPRWRVFALFSLALAGCGINPQKQIAIPTTKNFNAMGCEQLGVEKQRIESSYVSLRFKIHHGTQHAIRELNGETQAINDAIRLNGCRLANVQIPGEPITEVKAGK
jgi:hypothetical protein